MRPQDVVILCKLALLRGRAWKQSEVAQALFLSQAEVSTSLHRSRSAGLLSTEGQRVLTGALLEFLVHGLRYVFPAAPGPLVRGVKTAHSAQPLAQLLLPTADVFVWPYEDGDCRGQAITPLYPAQPRAALADDALYEVLALLDGLRVGRRREHQLATEELTRRIRAPEASP